MSRTFSTSSIQREVIQANGQMGSNQKSALVMPVQRSPGLSASYLRPGDPGRSRPQHA